MLLKVDPKQAHRYFVKMKNPIATTIAAKIAPPMKLATLNALPPSVSAFEIVGVVVLDVEVLDDGMVCDDVLLLVSNVSVVAGVEDVTSDVLTVVVNVEFDADEGLIVVDEEVVVLVVEAVIVFVDFTGTLLGMVTFSLTASSLSGMQKSSWQKQYKVDLFNELKGPEHPVLFSVAHPRS